MSNVAHFAALPRGPEFVLAGVLEGADFHNARCTGPLEGLKGIHVRGRVVLCIGTGAAHVIIVIRVVIVWVKIFDASAVEQRHGSYRLGLGIR